MQKRSANNKRNPQNNPAQRGVPKQAPTPANPTQRRPNPAAPQMRSRKPAPKKPSAQNQRIAPQKAKAPQRPPVQNPNPVRKPNPQPPLNKRNQAAVTQAMKNHREVKTRRKYRGGNYILYYILAMIIVVVVFIILANVMLFDSRTIEVEGNSRYTAEEIISASGLKVGDNLLHINKSSAENAVRSGLVYIDSAKVKKSYPSKIIISVEEAEKWFNVVQNGTSVAVSRKLRIIEQGLTDSLVTVRGYEAESLVPGEDLKSTVAAKTSLPSEILEAAEKAGLSDITEIDITDRFSIKVTVEGRVILELGNSSELEGKLIIAQKMIEEKINPEESVTLILTNTTQVAVSYNHPEQSSEESSSESLPKENSSSETPESTSSAE